MLFPIFINKVLLKQPFSFASLLSAAVFIAQITSSVVGQNHAGYKPWSVFCLAIYRTSLPSLVQGERGLYNLLGKTLPHRLDVILGKGENGFLSHTARPRQSWGQNLGLALL